MPTIRLKFEPFFGTKSDSVNWSGVSRFSLSPSSSLVERWNERRWNFLIE